MRISLPNGAWDIEWIDGVLYANGQRVDSIANAAIAKILIAACASPKRAAMVAANAVSKASRAEYDPEFESDIEVTVCPISPKLRSAGKRLV